MAEIRIGLANNGLAVNGMSSIGASGASPPAQVAVGNGATPLLSASGGAAGGAQQSQGQVIQATPGTASLNAAAQLPAAPLLVPAPALPPALTAPAAQPITQLVPAPVQVQAPISPPAAGQLRPLPDLESSPVAVAAASPALIAPELSPALATPSLPSNTESRDALPSSTVAAIAVPLSIVAAAVLLLAALVWWYKRHPSQAPPSPLTAPTRSSGARRRGRTDEESLFAASEKTLVILPGDHGDQSDGISPSRRGVTVTPHIPIPIPPPTVPPSIASNRRPTPMGFHLNITKPLPPVSDDVSEYDYACAPHAPSESSIGSYGTAPEFIAAVPDRRAERFIPTTFIRSAYPAIPEEQEDDVPERARSDSLYARRARPPNHRAGRPHRGAYSVRSEPLVHPERRQCYTPSLPASLIHQPPAQPPRLSHSPGSTASDSVPELDFPPDHPFRRSAEGDDMVRSITARTELTLPWGFAEAKRSLGFTLSRDETRSGADWAKGKR